MREVVCTGIGAVTARGDLLSAAGVRSISTVLRGAAVIESFNLKTYAVAPKTYLDRCSALAFAGCALALESSGLVLPLPDTTRFGIAVGTQFGCLGTMKSFWDKIEEKGVTQASPLLFSHSYFNSPISLCAIEWNLRGYHTTVCGADAGLDAIRSAWEAIALGHADAMLCGGVDAATPERSQMSGNENQGEASVFCVLETRERATGAPPLTNEMFDAVEQTHLRDAREAWGDCGAATSALALLKSL